jgi:ribose 5-phosphate isomerase B
MKIAIGADHAGFELKEQLKRFVEQNGHQIVDLGAYDQTPSDYPDFAGAVGQAIRNGQADRGIIVCGSGVGACIVANKIRGVRAAVCHDTYSAKQGVEHDDMNVLCLGSRVIGQNVALELVSAFLNAQFSCEERHARRLAKVLALEEQACSKSGPN